MVLPAKLRTTYDSVTSILRRVDRVVHIVTDPLVDLSARYIFAPLILGACWVFKLVAVHGYEEPDLTAWHEKTDRISALSIAEAKEVFLRLLAKGDVYSVVEEESNDPALDLLPPEIRSLLSRYRTVETDQCRLTRDAMSYDPVVPGTIWIGESWEDAVIIKVNEEPIYMDGPYLDESPLDEPIHQSVYHWLLCALPEESMPDVVGIDELEVHGDQ
jgi:hypothetical protein